MISAKKVEGVDDIDMFALRYRIKRMQPKEEFTIKFIATGETRQKVKNFVIRARQNPTYKNKLGYKVRCNISVTEGELTVKRVW